MSHQFNLTIAEAKSAVHHQERSRLEQVLLVLAVGVESKSISQLKQIALSLGLRKAKQWNLSDILSKSGGFAINTTGGWHLSARGEIAVAEITQQHLPAPAARKVAQDLRTLSQNIGSTDLKDYVREAVDCLERGLHRAAVVLAWVGAIAILQNAVVLGHLSAFNAQAKQKDVKWKDASTSDDLGRMKEFDFLEVLEKIGVVGKNVKQRLQDCLKLRNGCGHPTSLKVGQFQVAAHVETLILNVYMKF